MVTLDEFRAVRARKGNAMTGPSEYSLDDDLQVVRDIVARVADAQGKASEVFARLEDELRGVRRSNAELEAHADLLEAELARAVEERTVVVTQDGLASLSDEQARAVLQARVAAALSVFSKARYAGDAREVADLLRLFRSTDPVRVEAMRALLGRVVG